MSSKTKGILWFLLQCFTVSVTFAVVRFAIKDINIYTMTLIQTCIAFIMLLPVVLRFGIANLKTQKLKLHIIRNIFGLVGVSCFYYGVTKIHLNDATALSFTAPLWTTLAAILILKEKVKRYRLIGMIVSFIGALIVLRPSGEFDPHMLWILASVFLMGFVQVFIAQLNKTEPPIRIIFYMVFLSLFMTAPFAYIHWITPKWENIAWIFLLCCIVYINLFGVVLAYKYAEINVLMPLDFSRLIFTAIIAYLVFGEHLTPLTLIGSVVILAGIIYALHHERRSLKVAEL